MLNGAEARGFTVIELLVALTLAAVLLALGAPSMSSYMQNARVGAVTQSLHASLAMARTEAIRRNAAVQFVATNDNVAASDIASSVSEAANGLNWIVRAPTAASGVFELLDVRDRREGQAAAGAAPVAVAASSSAGAFTGIIVFNGFGGADATYTFEVTHPAAGACIAASGPIRCRRVRLSAGGQVRTCDPAVLDAGDTRFCSGA